MKRLFILALFAFAAWYGYKHYPELLNRTPGHEAVIVNQSGHVLTRVRLTVDGQSFAKERIADGEQATFSFKVARDSDLQLMWEREDAMGERRWRGGMVPYGPMTQRHFIQIDGDGQVVYEARAKGAGTPAPTP
jgi:hypothetical protein